MTTIHLNMNRHTVNVMSQLAEDATQKVEPAVGMPVTINYYTDRHAATIVRVPCKNKIIVLCNQVITLDYYAGKYAVQPETEGAERIFTKRKNGRWVAVGHDMHKGQGLSLGMHDHYIDPNF